MKFTRESLQLISSSILYEGSTNQYRLCIQEKANRVLLLNNIAPALRSLALSLLLQKPLKNINKKNDAKGKGTNGNDHGNHTDGDDGNFNNEVLFSVVRQLVFAEGSKNIPLEKIDKFVFEISSGETEPVVIFSMLYEEILELHKTYHFGKYSLCKSRIRTYVQFVLTCQKLRQCFFLFMQSLSQLLFIWIACNEAMSKQHRTNFVFSSKKNDTTMLLIASYLFAELISSIYQVNDAEGLLFTEHEIVPLLEVPYLLYGIEFVPCSFSALENG